MGSTPFTVKRPGMTSGYNPYAQPTQQPVTTPFAPIAPPSSAALNPNNYLGQYDQAALLKQQQAARLAAAQAANQAAVANYNNNAASSTNPYVSATNAASASAPSGQSYQSGSADRTAPGQGDVMDGFARRYLPVEAANVLSNPTIISQDLLGGTGKGALAGDAEFYAQMAPTLYKMLVGGNMKSGTMDNDNIINYVAKLMGDMSTVGGRTPTQGQLLNQLYAGLNDPNSEYGAQLYGPGGTSSQGTAQEVEKVNQLLGYTGTFSNYGTADAQKKLADRLGQEYMAAKAKGGMNDVTYMQYVQDNFLR